MKKNLLLIGALVGLSAPVVQSATLEDRVEELELSRDLNVVQFGGRFFSRYDNFTYANKNAATDTFNLWRLQFSLNLSANLSSKLKFYGRYTTSKLMNHYNRKSTDFNANSGNTINDSGMANSNSRDLQISDNFEGGPVTYLERAFFDYSIMDNLVFSIGRLPTVDGYPSNLKDGAPREGTYPALAYANVLDGLAVTYKLGFLPDNQDLSLRLIYHPFTNISLSNGITRLSNGGASALTPAGSLEEVSHVYTGMIDYSLRGTALADEVSLIVQQVQVEDLNFLYSSVSSHRVDYSISMANLMFNGIANTGATFGLSYAKTKIENSGRIIGSTGCSTNTGSTCSIFANNIGEDVDGAAFLVVASYTAPFLNNPTVGVEYINGDENYFKTDGMSHDLSKFYTTRGSGFHVYWNQPIESGLKWRFGYVTKTDEYDNNSAASFFGKQTAARKIDREVRVLYTHLRLDF